MPPLPARVRCHGPSAHVGTGQLAIAVSIAPVAAVAAALLRAE